MDKVKLGSQGAVVSRMGLGCMGMSEFYGQRDDAESAATLLRASCATRLAEGKASSLVVAGREGVPPEPDGLLSSPLIVEGWTETARTAAAEPREAAPLLTLRWPTALGESCR